MRLPIVASSLVIAAAAISLPSCGPSDQSAAMAAQSNQIAALKTQLAQRDATIAALNVAAKPPPAKAADVTTVDEGNDPEEAPPRASATSSRFPHNCYKDYCPCDPPQGGPDSVLCDQLEAGDDVAVDLMIAGRGMREARREMQTGDY